MSRFFVSPDSPEGWQAGLAKKSHWKPRYSAHSLAHAWHPADGFPASVARAFEQSELGPLEFLVGIPEYKVALPGGRAASQTDLFVLARTQNHKTVAIAVEGKAREPFGDNTVADWSRDASRGKKKRLEFLRKVLELNEEVDLGKTRYQLLHRAASPLIEKERLNAHHAVMLVHSFREPDAESLWFDEFANFAGLLGADVRPNAVVPAAKPKRSLFLGWISDPHPGAAA
jgi:hypothetical protein